MAYEYLSRGYDHLTTDVDYTAVANFIESRLHKCGIEDGIVLDLACGTGTVTYLMAERGYETIGVDISYDMLAVAESKKAAMISGIPPIFIAQDMRNLDLYGTVDACICMLDSINYITDISELSEVFRRIEMFLNPGGLLIFDINTPEKLASMDGRSFSDEREDEGIFCSWRVAQTETQSVYQFIVDMFVREKADRYGYMWRRTTEEHLECAYTASDIQKLLEDNKFTDIKIYSDLHGASPGPNSMRLYYTCKKSTG